MSEKLKNLSMGQTEVRNCSRQKMSTAWNSPFVIVILYNLILFDFVITINFIHFIQNTIDVTMQADAVINCKWAEQSENVTQTFQN